MLLRTLGLLLAASLSLPSLAVPTDSPRIEGNKVDFAYCDASATNVAGRRLVQLQGARDGSFRFDTACGGSGERCECLFFRSTQDRDPVRSAGSRASRRTNVFSCTVPSVITDAQLDAGLLTHALVRLRNGAQVTELTSVRSAISLQDVLGSLEQEQVRGIFRYSCSRTFFEGEGVSEQQISCLPGQHLGVIAARYNFYTFRSAFDVNAPGGDSAFPSDICGRNSFLKIQCTGNTPELRYGLYRLNEGPFVVGVTLTRAPEGENLSDTYGFAALPDENGVCAPGMEKARAWLAQPASMLPSGPSCPADGCPSNFINASGALGNTLVEISHPANFQVARQPNATPCDAAGSCMDATFGGAQEAQSVPYAAISPVVCVIPPGLLGGIF